MKFRTMGIGFAIWMVICLVGGIAGVWFAVWVILKLLRHFGVI
jgi:hypothetical protein